jgi:hypothetical protein
VPPTSRRRRGAAARIVTAAAAATLLAAGVTGTATAQSAGTGSATSTERATTTHDNLTVTHEIVGGNTGFLGDTIHVRTTVSATDGPARQITGIWESVRDTFDCYGHWTNKRSASMTYTNAAGERVTDAMPSSTPAAGSWRVDPVAGSTVVYDSVRTFAYGPGGAQAGCSVGVTTVPIGMDTRVVVHSDGLDPLDWNPTGVTLTCALGCRFDNPAGSVEGIFGS